MLRMRTCGARAAPRAHAAGVTRLLPRRLGEGDVAGTADAAVFHVDHSDPRVADRLDDGAALELEQAEGPFQEYRRTVEVRDGRVVADVVITPVGPPSGE